MKNRIYTFKLDADLDKRLQLFTEQLGDNEKIVAQSVDSANRRLIVTTVEECGSCKTSNTCKHHRNLLLEDIKSGKMRDVFGWAGKKDGEK